MCFAIMEHVHSALSSQSHNKACTLTKNVAVISWKVQRFIHFSAAWFYPLLQTKDHLVVSLHEGNGPTV